MSTNEVIRMAIVCAEHHAIRILTEHMNKRIVVASCRALTNKHFHARENAVTRLFYAATLMIGGDTSRGIAAAVVAKESRSMSINRFSAILRSLYLCHHLWVRREYTREVHHLREIANLWTFQHLCNLRAVYHSTRGFYICATRWYTRWCSEAEIELARLSVLYHIVNTVDTKNISNLMRIGDNTYGARLHHNLG